MSIDDMKSAAFRHCDKIVLAVVAVFVAMQVYSHFSPAEERLGGGIGGGAQAAKAAEDDQDHVLVVAAPFSAWLPMNVQCVSGPATFLSTSMTGRSPALTARRASSTDEPRWRPRNGFSSLPVGRSFSLASWARQLSAVATKANANAALITVGSPGVSALTIRACRTRVNWQMTHGTI